MHKIFCFAKHLPKQDFFYFWQSKHVHLEWGDKMRLRRESPKTDKDVKILTMIKRHRGEGGNKKLLNLWIPALIRRGRPNSPLESVLFWIEFQICSFACHQFIPSLIVLGLNYPNPKWYCPTTQKGGTKMMCIVWCWWRSWWWQGGGSDKRELDIGCALVCTVHWSLCFCVHCALVCTVHSCALCTCVHCALVTRSTTQFQDSHILTGQSYKSGVFA